MSDARLSDSEFLVLALLAERPAHGYEIHRLAHERGFRFWTQLRRTSIYNALAGLERDGLITARVDAGHGPERRIYRITRRGTARLEVEGLRHLATPGNPRSEVDLGIYALPFLSAAAAATAFDDSLRHLRARRAFLAERLAWCRARSLRLPALAFERPLVALDAEIAWLERVAREHASPDGDPPWPQGEWASYEYLEPPPGAPPSADADGAAPRARRRPGRGA